jgi:hypothetical protein
MAETPEIAVAQIIGEKQNNVRLHRVRPKAEARNKNHHNKQIPGGIHGGVLGRE